MTSQIVEEQTDMENKEKWKKIKICGNNKLYTLVDSKDYEELSKHKWYMNMKGYPFMNEYIEGKTFHFIISRLIMKCPRGLVVDHVNHNLLDNRRKNLRICDRQQNNWNKKKYSKNTLPKGVYIDKTNHKKPYKVKLQKTYFGGNYATKREAAIGYNELAKKHFEGYALLNKI